MNNKNVQDGKFALDIDGKGHDVRFQKAHGFYRELQTPTHNFYAQEVLKPDGYNHIYEPMIFEFGVDRLGAFKNWLLDVSIYLQDPDNIFNDVKFLALHKDVRVKIFGKDGQVQMSWCIRQCLPIKWEVDDLDKILFVHFKHDGYFELNRESS